MIQLLLFEQAWIFSCFFFSCPCYLWGRSPTWVFPPFCWSQQSMQKVSCDIAMFDIDATDPAALVRCYVDVQEKLLNATVQISCKLEWDFFLLLQLSLLSSGKLSADATFDFSAMLTRRTLLASDRPAASPRRPQRLGRCEESPPVPRGRRPSTSRPSGWNHWTFSWRTSSSSSSPGRTH